MNDIDRKIQSALSRTASRDSADGESNLAEEIITAFRGRHRWLSSLMIVINLLAFGCFILSAIRFYNAVDITVQLRWGGLAVVVLLVVVMIKIWFWLEMQSNRVLREMKRIELLLVSVK